MALGIAGLHKLVNPEEVKAGVDLKQLEQQLLNGGYTNKPMDVPPISKFEEELNKFSSTLGISSGKPKVISPSPSVPAPVISQLPTYDPFEQAASSIFNTKPEATTSAVTFDDVVVPDPGPMYSHIQYTNDATIGATNGGFMPTYGTLAQPSFNIDDAELLEKTAEQRRRAHIDSVLGTDITGMDFDAERREETKCYMIAQIDDLRQSLLEDGTVDISRVPQVTVQSSYDDVERILKILDNKSNQARCTSWAQELMHFVLYGCESYFDGTTDIMGFTPDLTGYSKHANVKIRRVKHEAGRMVHQFTQENNIPPLFRLLFEIIPSMILYSKKRNDEKKASSDW